MTEQEAEVWAESLKPFPPPYVSKHVPDEEEVTLESAEVWVVRLLRIWSPEGKQRPGVKCHHSKSSFSFEEIIEGEVRLIFIHRMNQNYASLISGRSCFLEFSIEEGAYCSVPSEYSQQLVAHLKPLVDEWLPFFRRGCWLSGCDIEASAHEKAEWMQDFSREELETWNLRF